MSRVKKICRLLLTGLVLTLGILIIAGCGRSNTATTATQSNKQHSSTIKFWHGAINQTAGIITVPIVMENGSQNDSIVNSKNFTLVYKNQKVPVFQAQGEASDYHDTFAAGDTWSNVVAFYIGTELDQSELSKLQFNYRLDNGEQITAKSISASSAQSKTSSDDSGTSNAKTLGDYYSDIKSYAADQKRSNSSDTSAGQDSDGIDSSQLKQQFNDSKYDQVRTWIAASTKAPKSIVVKISNQSNTDFVLSLSNIELVDNNNEEIQIAPSYRNYSVDLPHGKFTTVSLPLETNLNSSNGPYKVKFKANQSGNDDSNNSFFSTSSAPYPVEFALNNADSYADLYYAEPDTFNDATMEWTGPHLSWKSDTLKVKCMINDYFSIRAKATDFKLVGLTNDGSVGDSENAEKGAPMEIKATDSATQVKLVFGDLKTLKTYKHILLRYKDHSLCRIK